MAQTKKHLLQDGEKIRLIRENTTSLSQIEIAHHLGISQSSYCRIEKGDTSAKLPTLNKIADKFGVGVKDIISPEGIKILSYAEK